MPENDKTFYAAIEKWGQESQINQAIEECAELILILRHLARGKANIRQVATEIADVEIMCGQLRLIFGSWIIDEEKEFKINRLVKKLEK